MNKINTNLNPEMIFAKLDSFDTKGSDEKIEASIWNKFADLAGGNHIKKEICKEDALKSIANYLARATDEIKENIQGFIWKEELITENMSPEKKELHNMSDQDLKNKYNELSKQFIETKSSAGMSYKEARYKLWELWDRVANAQLTPLPVDSKLDKKQLQYLENGIKTYFPELLEKFNSAKKTIEEFENADPEFENKYEYFKLVENEYRLRFDKKQKGSILELAKKINEYASITSMSTKDLNAKFLELAKEVVDTKASNGMSYRDANDSLSELFEVVIKGNNKKEYFKGSGKILSSQDLKLLESAIKNQYPMYIERFENAKSAITELESKNPQIKETYRTFIIVQNELRRRVKDKQN